MPVTKSRLGLARPAFRPAMNARVMLSGPAGAGKTWTALAIAETLVPPGGRILGIDTEKESMLTFADEFVAENGMPIFEHLPWAAPFDPRELVDTLDDASGTYQCVIIDSGTHFWRGTGGTLDIANGRFTGWKEARPIQVDMVEAILRCDAHVIFCAREKMAYTQTDDPQRQGKQRVEKIGLEIQQDADFEYEVNVAISIDMQHTLQVSKSRTAAVPVGTVFHAGHAKDFAVTYRDWLAAGETVATRLQTDALIDELNTIEVEAERVKAKREFLDHFGRPEFLLESRLAEAAEWVTDLVLAANGGPVAGAATDPDREPEPEGSEDGTATAAERAAQSAAQGPGGPDRADGPGEPGKAASGPSGAAEAPTTYNGTGADPDGPEPGGRAALTEKLIGVLGTWTPQQVVEALSNADCSTNGAAKVRVARLAGHMVDEWSEAALLDFLAE